MHAGAKQAAQEGIIKKSGLKIIQQKQTQTKLPTTTQYWNVLELQHFTQLLKF